MTNGKIECPVCEYNDFPDYEGFIETPWSDYFDSMCEGCYQETDWCEDQDYLDYWDSYWANPANYEVATP